MYYVARFADLLSRSLAVPGLAEQRPSVLVGGCSPLICRIVILTNLAQATESLFNGMAALLANGTKVQST